MGKIVTLLIGAGIAYGAKEAGGKIGDGIGDGTRNALAICAVGAVLYYTFRKG